MCYQFWHISRSSSIFSSNQEAKRNYQGPHTGSRWLSNFYVIFLFFKIFSKALVLFFSMQTCEKKEKICKNIFNVIFNSFFVGILTPRVFWRMIFFHRRYSINVTFLNYLTPQGIVRMGAIAPFNFISKLFVDFFLLLSKSYTQQFSNKGPQVTILHYF